MTVTWLFLLGHLLAMVVVFVAYRRSGYWLYIPLFYANAAAAGLWAGSLLVR